MNDIRNNANGDKTMNIEVTIKAARDEYNSSAPKLFNMEAKGTKADLESFTSLFPKYCKVSIHEVNMKAVTGGDNYWMACTSNWLVADGVNGGVNETAQKRVAKILNVIEKAGIAIGYDKCFADSYETLDEAVAAVLS